MDASPQLWKKKKNRISFISSMKHDRFSLLKWQLLGSRKKSQRQRQRCWAVCISYVIQYFLFWFLAMICETKHLNSEIQPNTKSRAIYNVSQTFWNITCKYKTFSLVQFKFWVHQLQEFSKCRSIHSHGW